MITWHLLELTMLAADDDERSRSVLVNSILVDVSVAVHLPGGGDKLLYGLLYGSGLESRLEFVRTLAASLTEQMFIWPLLERSMLPANDRYLGVGIDVNDSAVIVPVALFEYRRADELLSPHES